MKLNHLQSLLSIRLESAFEEDVFVGMLNSTVTNNMAYGLASAVDFGKLQGTYDAFYEQAGEGKIDVFLTNVAAQDAATVWNKTPMANLLTQDFRAHALALVAAVALQLFKDNQELAGSVKI